MVLRLNRSKEEQAEHKFISYWARDISRPDGTIYNIEYGDIRYYDEVSFQPSFAGKSHVFTSGIRKLAQRLEHAREEGYKLQHNAVPESLNLSAGNRPLDLEEIRGLRRALRFSQLELAA